MARGAAQGAGACGGFLGGGVLGLAMTLVCLPFGALAGAALASTDAASEDSANAAKAKMSLTSDSLYLAPILSARVERYAREMGVGGPGLLRDQGPESPSDEPRYGSGDYVVEITLVDVVATTPGSVKLPYGFVVLAKGRLVRVADNTAVDTFSRRFNTNLRTVEQWTADEGAALSGELGSMMEDIAQTFMDEWILVYRGEPAVVLSDKNEEKRSPDYVLRPMDPPASASMRLRGPHFQGHLTPASVASVTPTLVWERLPRTMPAELFAGAEPRARNLSYEVQVLDGAGRRGVGPYAQPVPTNFQTFLPARRVRSYSGLVEPKLDIEAALLPCKYYFWSVRAHFDLDGRKRVTEWSGAYIVLLYGEQDPSSMRRTGPTGSSMFRVGTFPMYGYFFPFKTPSADSKECGEVG